MTRVLVIEDDPIIGEMLTLYLAEENFEVRRVETAREGKSALCDFLPDIMLLDLMLPDASGTELCAEFRQLTAVPIIVISMKPSVTARIQAISYGADDYLVKPFSMQELKVRMEAVLRRTSSLSPVAQPIAVSQLSGSAPSSMDDQHGLALDLERRTIVLDGVHIETTFSEYEIMKLFYQHPNRVFTREELINAVRGIDSFVNDRAIDVHVTNLRRKLEKNPKEPQFIKTVWGVGYKFLKG
ncbi:response regulator transcription factor [Cohnella terricola]|uniref:Response regulator transcription factor n=1 Tax=Cohnella terricola TaxID=1289167 RepID=A0A559JR85_9BACL|nr:response regulator transcription factor [Cohnella terricola]TVY02386.1 response regulator transcription factor [Cohnella terricola]